MNFLSNYQKEEQILRNSSKYIFKSVDILGIYFHNIKLKRGSPYIKSPKWISDKKATINPKNTKDNKCFQYSIIAALHHHNIKSHPERISNIRPYIANYNWKDIDFPAGIKDWEKFERNNKDIALNILYASPNKKTINIAYTSKYNRKCKNQVVLLMITDKEKRWHYIALKSELTDNGYKKPTQSLSKLYRGITSNHNGDFHCLGLDIHLELIINLKNMKDYLITINIVK